ncbi:MAG: hypothetical protein E4H14_03350 [Candidatus Thorarchaeota archaeon]|nr:MAG: hypothetical protein E4H14_03350 [Candidatus Thorarchaeota archaeon]
MSEKKEMVVNLIVKRNVSAIITLSEKLEIETEAVIELINELISEGKLQGTFTEDGKRFFRSDAKVSDAPVIEREDIMPEFLSYNTKPGYVIAIIGALILGGGAIVNIYATDATEYDFAAILFLIGILILFTGLYLVAKRNPPS